MAEADEVWAALGLARFEGLGEGRLRLCGAAPAWLPRAFGRRVVQGEALEPGETLPALAGFLVAAEGHWGDAEREPLGSGVLEERDAAGAPLVLEAYAADARTLVVRDLGREIDVVRGRFQTARETFLGFEQLRAEVEKKELLLHCIVHDLKGPLAGIVGHLSLLESRSFAPERGREIAGKALEQARRQLDMIQLVLEVFSSELQRMEAFETSAARAPDLRACVADAVASCAPAFEQRGVELRVELAGDAPLLVVASGERLTRAIVNLLENALRHAPAGSAVELAAREDAGSLLLTVEDRGPGVPADVVPRLFQRFGQGRGCAGLAGLGLYSARLAVERWGGAVGYEPREGGGARFWLRLVEPQE